MDLRRTAGRAPRAPRRAVHGRPAGAGASCGHRGRERAGAGDAPRDPGRPLRRGRDGAGAGARRRRDRAARPDRRAPARLARDAADRRRRARRGAHGGPGGLGPPQRRHRRRRGGRAAHAVRGPRPVRGRRAPGRAQPRRDRERDPDPRRRCRSRARLRYGTREHGARHDRPHHRRPLRPGRRRRAARPRRDGGARGGPTAPVLRAAGAQERGPRRVRWAVRAGPRAGGPRAWRLIRGHAGHRDGADGPHGRRRHPRGDAPARRVARRAGGRRRRRQPRADGHAARGAGAHPAEAHGRARGAGRGTRGARGNLLTSPDPQGAIAASRAVSAGAIHAP